MKSSRPLSAICIIAMIISLAGCCGNTKDTETKAKYIFLFIGDGMGNTHVAATESYLSYKAGKLGGEKLIFSEFPYVGLASTYSANASVTCSSAAGTAIACGAKTNNGMVGMDPDGNHLKSMAYELKEDGYKIGIMSSVPMNHATPSSFYAHNRKRSNHYELSQEIPASGFEFFGGDGFLDPKGKDGKSEATDAFLENNGYKVCYSIEEFNEASSRTNKIVFSQPGTRDSEAEQYTTGDIEAEDASLAEIVDLAIGFLGDEDPFFMMCEGGAIDWEAHSNQTMGTIKETLDFDKAVRAAYQFYLAHPEETLIVVTADHETGGMTIGADGGESVVNWARLEANQGEESRELNAECSIGWTTGGHAGAPVPVYAIGKGAEKFTGKYDNTDIKGKILGE